MLALRILHSIRARLKRTFNALLNLGVSDDLPVYEGRLVRFTNFLELFSLFFYMFYCTISIVLHARFSFFASLSLTISGCIGLWFNYKRRYLLARSIFTSSFSIILFFVINTLNIGFSFFAFFFPTFVSFALYYDLENGLKAGLISLFITV